MTLDAQTSGQSDRTNRTADECEFVGMYERYLASYRPLHLESSEAWWAANVTGSNRAFERKQAAEKAILELHSDRSVFARLKELKDGVLTDPTIRRQHDVLYYTFLSSQAASELHKRLVDLENQVEQTFNTHRSDVDGKALTENDVREILTGSTDSRLVESAWKGYMAVGPKVAGALREVVALRNQIARELGYRNFYVMELDFQEIKEAELMRVFDELDALTRRPFAALKAELDEALAKRFGVAGSALRPWHYSDLFLSGSRGQGRVRAGRRFRGAGSARPGQTLLHRPGHAGRGCARAQRPL